MPDEWDVLARLMERALPGVRGCIRLPRGVCWGRSAPWGEPLLLRLKLLPELVLRDNGARTTDALLLFRESDLEPAEGVLALTGVLGGRLAPERLPADMLGYSQTDSS